MAASKGPEVTTWNQPAGEIRMTDFEQISFERILQDCRHHHHYQAHPRQGRLFQLPDCYWAMSHGRRESVDTKGGSVIPH